MSASSSEKTSSRSSRPLACVLCQRRKVKCDRKYPCANCIKVRDLPFSLPPCPFAFLFPTSFFGWQRASPGACPTPLSHPSQPAINLEFPTCCKSSHVRDNSQKPPVVRVFPPRYESEGDRMQSYRPDSPGAKSYWPSMPPPAKSPWTIPPRSRRPKPQIYLSTRIVR